jgi:murein DD-endopeptidase MepM/ murein hydrolase activator NlpD
MFSENMVPIMTNVDIVFRRNVDMQPEARTSFVNSLKSSGVAGEGGGSASGGGGDTDPSGGAVNVPGIRDGNGYDPMSAFKKWGLSGGSWTYGAGSSNDPYSKKSHGGALHQAWDIGAPFATPLLAGVYGVVGDLNDGVKDNVAGHNPGSGSPSNWITIHCKYKGADATVYYQHLHQNSISVSRGTKVTPTTRIAQTGNSGNSSGPHLHLATWTGRRMANTRYPTKDAEIIWAPSVLFANQGR